MTSVVVGDGGPGVVGAFVLGDGAGFAEVLDEDVLDVGSGVGEAPGDEGVAADDDEGNAGEGEAFDVEGRGAVGVEGGFVPDVGGAEAEVHVVGEERGSGGGVGAGDDPVVGAVAAAVALVGAEVAVDAEEVLGTHGRLGGVEGDLQDGGGGGGEVGSVLGRGLVAPGAYRVEVGEKVGGEVGGEGLAIELGGEVGGEVLGHDEGDEEGVAGLPEGGSVVQDVELDGQGVGAVGAVVGGDVGVDAAGIGLELVKLVGGKGGGGSVGGGAELEDALLAVVLDEGGTKDLGEGSGAVAAESVHLEEAVGGGDVALGEEQVIEVGGVDGGDVLRVAGDGDGSGEAGDRDAAVEEALVGEEVGAHVVAQDDGGDREGEGEKDEEGAEGGENAEERAELGVGVLGGWVLRGVLHGGQEWGLGVGWGGAMAKEEGVFGLGVGRGEVHGLMRF